MTIKPRILLFGANGQLGFELRSALALLGDVLSLTRQDVDLGMAAGVIKEAIEDQVRRYEPNIIVNAAAYTAVDKAESEPELAHLINAQVPAWLAQAASQADACLVHYSTDYVFDGKKPLSASYVESDTTHPLSVYGRTKLAGEQAIAAACSKYLILRTSWVVGQHGGNFLKTMLRLSQERNQLRVVADQWGAPTSAALIASVTAQVLQVMFGQTADDSRWGIYHLAAAGKVNWHGYAQHVIRYAQTAGLALKLDPDSIEAIATSDYPVAATRPLNSSLNTTKIQTTFGIDLPDWKRGVDRVLQQVLPTESSSVHKSL